MNLNISVFTLCLYVLFFELPQVIFWFLIDLLQLFDY